MRHYPTSAELASFRAATHNATIAEVERITGRPVMAFVHPSASPAFPSELRHGIGYRAAEGYAPEYVTPDPGQPWDGYHVSMSANDADRVYAIRARREASRMRSRAFSALVATGPWPIGHGYEDGSRVCPIERSNGLPVEIGHYA